MHTYSIGLDYGTLSCRAVLVDIHSGEEIATSIYEYPHGVMDEYLGNVRLPPEWALQDPQDYIDALRHTLPDVLKKAGVPSRNIVGVGVDFTSCTILPVDRNGLPLCFDARWKARPHAYVKLWKHHAAQEDAVRLNETAEKRGEDFLYRYGGKISSEWMIPKIMQILREDPEVFDHADRFMEASDWVVMQMTGVETRSSCGAGYKAVWSKRQGYPAQDFFRSLDPRLGDIMDTKLSGDILPIGAKAGEVTEACGAATGLSPGTAVAVSIIDAHAAVPALGITQPGKMLMIMGTSTCHMVLDEREYRVPGIGGVVEDGIIPGLFGYEAGQACVGDHFEWFVNHCVPAGYREEAQRRGIDIHALLTEKAAAYRPGQTGLIALDWWNGNRSTLVDADLTGAMVGMTLQTRPEEIYRTLIEATAFGTRAIIEAFEENGVVINELYACGGIAEKNSLVMQIYSDVTGREIKIAASSQAPAIGAAMYGAVAAGTGKGGFDTIQEAAGKMAKVKEGSYLPIEKNMRVYDMLYAEYSFLYEYFGRKNDLMKRLKRIRNDALHHHPANTDILDENRN